MFLAVGCKHEQLIPWVMISRSLHTFIGLVLRKVHQDDLPTYRRIGLGRWVSVS